VTNPRLPQACLVKAFGALTLASHVCMQTIRPQSGLSRVASNGGLPSDTNVTVRVARGACARGRGRTSCGGEKGCFVGPVSNSTGSVRGYLGVAYTWYKTARNPLPGGLEPLEAREVTLG